MIANVAVFARRQQHARVRLQWQDMGSSVVWLRNREMQRLLLSISKVGMGFALQKKKMDVVLKNMRDARNRSALQHRELNAACRPAQGGQVVRVMPEIPDRDLVVLRRYMDWWAEAAGEGLDALQDAQQREKAFAQGVAKGLSRLQIQMLEQDRLRGKEWEEEQGADPSFRRLREEEIETCVLDVRADDLAGQSY